MRSQLTHERCSELLADYLAGELEPEQHRHVEDHLEHCAQCSDERAGLSAFLSGESDDLTEEERVVLRAAVLGSILEEPADRRLEDESDAVVVPLGGRGARVSKYLGIAAMLAILAVGSLFVFRGGLTGSDDETGDAGSASFGEAEDSDEQADEGAAAEPVPEDGFRNAQDLHPRFQADRGAISAGDLDRLGRQNSSALSDTQAAFQTDSAREANKELRSARAPEDLLRRLAARAPGSLASDITECGRTALDELDRPALATYATTATLEGTDVVVLGFVTGDRRPDRYAVFAFPLGDCTTILTSTEGPID